MKKFDRWFYIAVLVLSAAFLFFGNRIASQGMFVSEFEPMPVYSAIVREITERQDMAELFGFDFVVVDTIVLFNAEITSGGRAGEMVQGEQSVTYGRVVEVKEGDGVLLVHDTFHDVFWYDNHMRTNYIVILGIVFFVLVVVFGKLKGLNSIIALTNVCMGIFLVLIPAILSGMNIYVAAAVISLYSIVSTLLIVIGANKKAFSAMIGCLGGVLLAGVLMFAMDIIMGLTGLVDHETRNLLLIPTAEPINIRAVIFAGVIIGSTGAIMDVAMSISSSLWEVMQARQEAKFRDIFKSGLEIGKDILGTMLNTLILAYIGSTLPLIILLMASTTSLLELFNMELIILEFLRALVGSFGMFLTIPLTAVICGWLYTKKATEISLR
ncbi:MAG: YibE/F family protein [Defluviitaleaceae bacterium]|nr:YibE/F family protein [Defluviitaleaceae bacterium]